MDQVCKYLEWDSNFFSLRIARANSSTLDQKHITAIFDWCKNHQIECLYFLAEANDLLTHTLAQKNKFHFVDVRITLENSLKDIKLQLSRDVNVIRPSTEMDIPVLREISRGNYRDSRFYYDTNFPVSLVDALYETWIETSCRGYADLVLVAEQAGNIAGYVSCHLNDPLTGQIGLIGVHPDWQGRGIGKALVQKSLSWFAGQGTTKVQVVTQARNVQALRLYERCGFLAYQVQNWYHRWFR